jgi:hypothetical protein
MHVSWCKALIHKSLAVGLAGSNRGSSPLRPSSQEAGRASLYHQAAGHLVTPGAEGLAKPPSSPRSVTFVCGRVSEEAPRFSVTGQRLSRLDIYSMMEDIHENTRRASQGGSGHDVHEDTGPGPSGSRCMQKK